MSYELTAVDDKSCKLVERATGADVTNTISIPIAKSEVVAVMRKLLRNQNETSVISGMLSASRMRDQLKLSYGAMYIPLPWNVVFAIVLEDV